MSPGRTKLLLGVILVMAASARLYHVDFPIAGWHAWRQSDTAGIAWNFLEHGHRLLFPQVIWSGNTSGYVEAELQIFPFLVSLLYHLFHFSDLWGRLLSVVFSLASIPLLCIIVHRILGQRTALWSAAIYALLPLNVYYGRAFMPESMLLFCALAGMHFFARWLDEERRVFLFLSWLFLSLAVLIKLPILPIGLPLAYLCWVKYGRRMFSRASLWLFAAGVLLPVVLWYLHAHELYEDSGLTFGIWNFSERKFGARDLLLNPAFYDGVFLRTVGGRHLTYAGLVLLLIGLFLKRTAFREHLFDWWLLGTFIGILIVGKHNQEHDYYQLPLIIPAVVLVAKACSRFLSQAYWADTDILKKGSFLAVALLTLAILPLSLHRYLPLMSMERNAGPVFAMGNDIGRLTSPKEKIVSITSGSPWYLYSAKRRGWIVGADTLNASLLERLGDQGATLFCAMKEEFSSPERKKRLDSIRSRFPLLVNAREYVIGELRPPRVSF